MATKKIKRFESGGVTDKDRGLEASKDDKVGFFERMRMGNIDEEGSEAYNRFGAGRAKADRDAASEAAAMRAVDASRAAPAASADQSNSQKPAPDRTKLYEKGTPKHLTGEAYIPSVNFRQSAYEDMINPEGAGEIAKNGKFDIAMPSDAGSSLGQISSAKKPKPVGRGNVDVQAGKPSTPAKSSSGKSSAYPMTKAQPTTKTYDRTGGPTADELANYKPTAKLTKKQEIEKEIDAIKPTAEQTQKGLEDATMLTGGIGLKALQGLAKKLAAPKLSKYSQEALPAPTKRLSYDKAGAFSRKRSERADARREEMLKENAKRYGLDEGAPGYEATAAAVRKGLGGKDFSLKKGGSLKRSAPVKKMASGGMVSNASKRADGIATKGKTRCKMR